MPFNYVRPLSSAILKMKTSVMDTQLFPYLNILPVCTKTNGGTSNLGYGSEKPKNFGFSLALHYL